MTQPILSSQLTVVNPTVVASKPSTILAKMSIHLADTYSAINQHYYGQKAKEQAARKRTLESTTEVAKKALTVPETPSVPKGLSEYLVSEKDFLPIPRGFELRIKGAKFFAKAILGEGNYGKVLLFCQTDQPSNRLAVKMASQRSFSIEGLLVERKIFQRLQAVTPPSLRELMLQMEDYRILETLHKGLIYRTHFLAMELMSGGNLLKITSAIAKTTKTLPILTITNIRKIIRRIVQTLHIFNLAKLIHCDLKPENVFTDSIDPSLVKVGDFGASFSEEDLKENELYEFVSRWYRAPEILMQKYPYNKALDVWSLGCVAAELYTGEALFTAKEYQREDFSSAAHLLCIMQLLGPPPREMIDCKKEVLKHLYEEIDGSIRPKPGVRIPPQSRSLQNILKGAPPEFLDFVTRAIDWDPEKRMTIEEALQHPFLSDKP